MWNRERALRQSWERRGRRLKGEKREEDEKRRR